MTVTLTFLGTNGWFDTDTGNTISMLIDTPSYGIVLDAGFGFAKLDRHASLEKPFFLLLSHLHLDHVAGLHTLVRLRFLSGLDIVVPPEQKEPLERLIAPPFTVSWDKLPFDVRIREYGEARGDLPFGLEAYQLRHPVPTVGYRILLSGIRIAWVADTGECDNAVKLAAGADWLISECAYLPEETGRDLPHLNPQSAARIAREAGVRELVLTHFDASRYHRQADRERAEARAREIFPNTRVARDGLRLELTRA